MESSLRSTSYNAAYQLIAGVDIPLHNRFLVGAKLRYMNAMNAQDPWNSLKNILPDEGLAFYGVDTSDFTYWALGVNVKVYLTRRH